MTSALAYPSQLLLAYYTGVSPDTIGTAGLNALALAFFDPLALSQANCDFSGPSSPCLAPASGSGNKDLLFVHTTVNETLSQLVGPSPLYLISFGGANCGGAEWDKILGDESLSAAFGTNAAALVAALEAAYPTASFGIDLDIEGTSTTLPSIGSLVTAYRAGANTNALQLCALSGLALPSSSDHFKVQILTEYGPAQSGFSHVNMMVAPNDGSCLYYAPFWNHSALSFLPAGSRVGGVWGEIYPTWILHGPGCVDGTAPLFQWMQAENVGVGVWQWWDGPSDGVAALISAVKAT